MSRIAPYTEDRRFKVVDTGLGLAACCWRVVAADNDGDPIPPWEVGIGGRKLHENVEVGFGGWSITFYVIGMSHFNGGARRPGLFGYYPGRRGLPRPQVRLV